jgi:OmpA-OmpF porin, OOP family
VRGLWRVGLVSLALGVRGAWAQAPREPLDVERFKPALTWDGFVVTEGSDVRWPLPDDPLQLGVAVNTAFEPLVVVGADGAVVGRFVERRTGLDLFGSMTLVRDFAVGVGLPVFVLQSGDGDPNPSGVGDLRIVPKLRLRDDRRGLGVAVLAEIRAPTHSDEEFSGGARFPAFAPRLAVDHRFGGGLRVGGNAGLLLRRATEFENVRAASELTYSAAAVLHLGGYDGAVALGVDLHGGAGLTALSLEELPLEGQLYAQVQARDVQLQLGPAVGVVPGYGTPAFRLYAGVRWSPTGHDLDRDGIPDRDDACPSEPETRNGVDDLDGCPEGTQGRAPEPGQGPSVVRVIVVDRDGQPVPKPQARVDDARATATGAPGVLEVEVEPGTYELWVRARGYVPQRLDIEVPDGQIERTVQLEPIEVVVTDDRIEFAGTVYFAFGSAVLLAESHDLLDEIALVLIDQPQLRRVRVEGHTDRQGSADYNQRLSEARASSVVAYLIGAGVEEERLEAVGFGESRPISKIDQENRRVDFVIVSGRLPGVVEAPEPE